MLGAALGIVAYKRILLSGGMLRGRRTAQTAIILGAALGLGGGISWSYLVSVVQTRTNETAVREVEMLLRAAQHGDVAAVRGVWLASQASRLTDETIAGFGRSAAERYGEFRSFRVTSLVAGSGMLGNSLVAAGTFSFAQRDLPGSAQYAFEQEALFALPVLKLQRVVIEDAQNGDLSLPPGSGRAATSPANSATAPKSQTTAQP